MRHRLDAESPLEKLVLEAMAELDYLGLTAHFYENTVSSLGSGNHFNSLL